MSLGQISTDVRKLQQHFFPHSIEETLETKQPSVSSANKPLTMRALEWTSKDWSGPAPTKAWALYRQTAVRIILRVAPIIGLFIANLHYIMGNHKASKDDLAYLLRTCGDYGFKQLSWNKNLKTVHEGFVDMFVSNPQQIRDVFHSALGIANPVVLEMMDLTQPTT